MPPNFDDQTGSAVLTLSVAEELLTSLERLCVNAAAERSADIQATLTTVAVIFLPLICISSIFAMNFQYMPELKSNGAIRSALALWH